MTRPPTPSAGCHGCAVRSRVRPGRTAANGAAVAPRLLPAILLAILILSSPVLAADALRDGPAAPPDGTSRRSAAETGVGEVTSEGAATSAPAFDAREDSAAPVAPDLFDAETLAFLRKLHAPPLSRLPVQISARVAVLDTLARDQVSQATGEQAPADLAPAVAFLELYFNAGHYLGRPVLYVREATARAWFTDSLPPRFRPAFAATHRIPPAVLADEEALELLLATGRADLADLETVRDVPSLRSGLMIRGMEGPFRVPIDRLQLRYAAFFSADALRVLPDPNGGPWRTPEDFALRPGELGPRLSAAYAHWRRLQTAWRSRDADAVNGLIDTFPDEQEALAGAEALPPKLLRDLEVLYNRTDRATITWVGFAVSLVLLLFAVATERRGVRRLGLGVFALSTLALGAGFVVRWILSGRGWHLPPILNQFEAVTASALLGGLLALGLEAVRPRGWFALAAAFYATVGLLSCFFLPGRTGAGITAIPGILDAPIMSAHVAVIIVGHALVGMTLPISLALLGVAAVRGSGSETLRVIDRCNVLVAQLATWTVAGGTILGAVWAHAAWGRFWGWDPKETWALITVLILLATLHLRFVVPPRSRGTLTAVGCLLAVGAMLFNWIVVNYLLPGLHSYA